MRVQFLVLPDGSVTSVKLISLSGISELDTEVPELLEQASPVAKPPTHVNPFITVPVSFSIRR
ncbi:energy transducer TonB family protein [Ochrobactrum sp. MYb379]|uniref:energy transducer TonB family protein n=1 Tax=Ochrobactrum sp. MYb379 TaxID=2745275 RepID=UPI00403F001F